MNYKSTLRSVHNQPHWSLEQTISMLGTYYMKLTIIEEMNKLYNRGIHDSDIVLATSSLNLNTKFNDLEQTQHINIDNESFLILEEKSIDANSFWKTFHKLKRPAVFYRENGNYKFVYTQEHALKFENIETNSPQLYKLVSSGVAFLWLLNIVGTHYVEKVLDEIDETVLSAIQIRSSMSINPTQNIVSTGDIVTTPIDIHTNSYLEEDYNQILTDRIERMLNRLETLEREINEQRNHIMESKIKSQQLLIEKQSRAINMLQEIKRNIEEKSTNENELLPFLKNERNIELNKLQKRLNTLPLILNDFAIA